jgi:hypothetical protein
MESLITRIFLHQWQKKLVALVTAMVVWIFVNHSITSTIVIPSVPVRVINLPADKTISRLLPNGFLSKRTTLTLTGTKDVIEQLEPGDLEVLLDLTNQPDEGIVQITKKNLVSLNPNINLSKHITGVSHPELMIRMSSLVTEKIPVTIYPSTGEVPKGYEYIDLWPIFLTQTVVGPQDEVLKLKKQGIELIFPLEDITSEQLDSLHAKGSYDDEITYLVPDSWKKVSIPFLTRGPEPLNDPEAKFLQINFLKKQLIPIKSDLPIHIFYSLKYSSSINPSTYVLEPNNFVMMKDYIPILNVPLLAANVSKLFVDIIKDNIEIQIVTAPTTERERLQWGIGFIDQTQLEDTYAAFVISNAKTLSGNAAIAEKENHSRLRFREYMQRFSLYLSQQQKLEIESSLDGHQIRLHVPNAMNQPKQSNAL